MYFNVIRLDISSLPVFQQISDLFALLMQLVYNIGEAINVRHSFFYIILFTFLTKIIFLPIELGNLRNGKISQWTEKETKNNNKRYSKSAIVPYKPKMLLEKNIIESRYGYNGSFALKALFIQLPLIFIIYSIVGNLTKYIPALSSLSDSEISTLYTLWGCDLREKPILTGFKITPMVIFPIIAVLVPTLSTVINNKIRGKKNDVSVWTSNILTLIFGLRFATYLSIYWIAQSLFSFIVSLIFTLITKNKDNSYYLSKTLEKCNKNRIKRKLPPLKEPLVIPEVFKESEK